MTLFDAVAKQNSADLIRTLRKHREARQPPQHMHMAIDGHPLEPAFPRELERIIFQIVLENSMTNAKNLIFISVFDWCRLFWRKNLDN